MVSNHASVDDSDLAGLDPYELMGSEATRLDRFFSSAGPETWEQPTRCAGWSTRDLLAHLAASEDYNQACLDGGVQDFLVAIGAKGAVDLASANEIALRELDDESPEQLLATWRDRAQRTRDGFRARDGSDVDSSVGAYPARWQAFHLAFELATHADDLGVPVGAEEAAPRLDWQVRFGRFAIKELKPGFSIDGRDGVTHVRGDGIDVEMPDAQFVQVVAARLPEDSEIDATIAATLSATP